MSTSNWIAVQKHTPRKPMIRHIARHCKCSRGDAFLAWFLLWSFFDEQTADGFIPFYTKDDADEEAGLDGIGEALDGKWLIFDKTGCMIVKWDRHNGKSAKRRALDAERKRQKRAQG